MLKERKAKTKMMSFIGKLKQKDKNNSTPINNRWRAWVVKKEI